MAFLLRRRLLRTFFQALEKLAGNVGLIREAGKEMRLFSHEEVTLVRQLGESRQRLLDLEAARNEQKRQLQSAMARQVLEAIQDVERRQHALMARQAQLLMLCRQVLHQQGGGEAPQAPGQGASGAAAPAQAAGSAGRALVAAAAAGGVEGGQAATRFTHRSEQQLKQQQQQPGQGGPAAVRSFPTAGTAAGDGLPGDRPAGSRQQQAARWQHEGV